MNLHRTPTFRRPVCAMAVLTTWAILAAGFCPSGLAADPGVPQDVLGLYLWYKADSITGVDAGQVVTQWNDDGPKKTPSTSRSAARRWWPR